MPRISNHILLVILFASAGALFTAYTVVYDNYKPLPVYGPTSEDGIAHTVPEYTFTDHEGELFSTTDYEGQVAVVNFFFTSCPSICPAMMKSMKRIQAATVSHADQLQLVSLTVDPKRDDVDKLKKYADRTDVKYDRWRLLTGDKKDLYYIARKAYYLVATEGDGGAGDFIHSEKLVLVDREGKIRGYYDGTDSDSVNDLIRDMRRLLNNKV